MGGGCCVLSLGVKMEGRWGWGEARWGWGGGVAVEQKNWKF